MAEIIRMPRLSDTMEEGVIVEWLKKVGDAVEPGDILAEVETDKATMELESYHEGVLLHIGVREGAVPVNGILAVIGENGEDFTVALELASAETGNGSSGADSNGVDKQEVGESTDQAGIDQSNENSDKSPIVADYAQPSSSDDRIKASPLARKMAAEKGVSLQSLSGSGEHGRIVKQDILSHLEMHSTVGSSAQTTVTFEASTDTKEVLVSQMRKVIAKRLSQSKFSSPHFYVTVEIDMTNAIAARKQLNEKAPPKISFNDLIVKASALSLRHHPNVNSSWLGDKIRINGNVNIGIAVAVEDGLMVPVVNQADQKSLTMINEEVKELAEKARDRKLQPEQMQGNTFTISNLGMFDVDEFTGIINPPDACILAVGSITEKPVVKNGEIVIGHIMKVTLSSDHRVVDGATAATFLQTMRGFLENPIKMLL